jgi:hypothetical protein
MTAAATSHGLPLAGSGQERNGCVESGQQIAKVVGLSA